MESNKVGRLVFNLEDHQTRRDFSRAVNVDNVYLALSEIADEVFRPARKHGYTDRKINELMDDKGAELIGLLEEKFYELLKYHKVDLYE